jgi:hypothetical protein
MGQILAQQQACARRLGTHQNQTVPERELVPGPEVNGLQHVLRKIVSTFNRAYSAVIALAWPDLMFSIFRETVT